MKYISVPVPEGGSCKGCDFLSHVYKCEYCVIFKREIENYEKCFACRIFAERKERDL